MEKGIMIVEKREGGGWDEGNCDEVWVSDRRKGRRGVSWTIIKKNKKKEVYYVYEGYNFK